jgi:DSF synthase
MILSCRMYSAFELHEMGVVDVLAEEGEGEAAVYDFIKTIAKKEVAYQSVLKIRQRYSPVTYEELMDVAMIWVDCVLKIGTKEIKIMERLMKAQDKATGRAAVLSNIGESHSLPSPQHYPDAR